MINETELFGRDAANYERMRAYDTQQMDALYQQLALAPAARIADIGAGPGQIGLYFAKRGHAVDFVEPNEALRQICDQHINALGIGDRCRTVDALAHRTSLASGQTDLLVVADALGWLKPPQDVAKEFHRILAKDGKILVLNRSLAPDHPFTRALHEFLLEENPDYKEGRQFLRAADNPFENTVAQFLDRTSIAQESKRLLSQYTPDEWFDFLKTCAPTCDYIEHADKHSIERLKTFLQSQVDASGNIEVAWDSSHYLGRPRTLAVSKSTVAL
jgi:ubiquinone/menaquinone biosynthesis C-methylase UbiE